MACFRVVRMERIKSMFDCLKLKTSKISSSFNIDSGTRHKAGSFWQFLCSNPWAQAGVALADSETLLSQ